MLTIVPICIRRACRGRLIVAVAVAALNPGQDRRMALLAAVPAATVQDVLLQQGEVGLHGIVVSGRGDPAHGPVQAPGSQSRVEEAVTDGHDGRRHHLGHAVGVGASAGLRGLPDRTDVCSQPAARRAEGSMKMSPAATQPGDAFQEFLPQMAGIAAS